MYHTGSLDKYPERTFSMVNSEGNNDQTNIKDDVIIAPICQHVTSAGKTIWGYPY